MPFKSDNYSELGSAWHHLTEFLSASYLYFPSPTNPYFIFRCELVGEGQHLTTAAQSFAIR